MKLSFYRQDAAKRQTAGIKFTQAKNRVFRPAGATLCTNSRQTWQGRRAHGSKRNFTSIATGGGNAAPKYQKFPLFGKESPPLTDFENF